MDSSGDAYVTRHTDSTNFPTTAGAFQTTLGGGRRCLREQAEQQRARPWSTPPTSAAAATMMAMASRVDSSGNAYVTGFTYSTNFPTTAGAFQTTLGGGTDNAFVSKLNSSGSALVYSTYLGGTGSIMGVASQWTRRAMPTSPAPPIPPTFRPRRARSRPLSVATATMRSSASSLSPRVYPSLTLAAA